jgi:hypothetical protein
LIGGHLFYVGSWLLKSDGIRGLMRYSQLNREVDEFLANLLIITIVPIVLCSSLIVRCSIGKQLQVPTTPTLLSLTCLPLNISVILSLLFEQHCFFIFQFAALSNVNMKSEEEEELRTLLQELHDHNERGKIIHSRLSELVPNLVPDQLQAPDEPVSSLTPEQIPLRNASVNPEFQRSKTPSPPPPIDLTVVPSPSSLPARTRHGQSNEELLEDFVFKPEQEIRGIKVNDLREITRGIAALKRWVNGTTKDSLVKHYMEWQNDMRKLAAGRRRRETRGTSTSEVDTMASYEDESMLVAMETEPRFVEAQYLFCYSTYI